MQLSAPPTLAALALLLCRALVAAVLLDGASAFSLRAAALSSQRVSGAEVGDLMHRVSKKLTKTHRALGDVSKDLMGVQGEVDRTEQSLLGKVFDLQTARGFYANHQQVDAQNTQAKAAVEKLSQQVQELSTELSVAQSDFVADGHAEVSQEQNLTAQAIADEAELQELKSETDKDKDVESVSEKLATVHHELASEATKVAKVEGEARTKLTNVQAASKYETCRHRILRRQVFQMHNYSVMCNSKVKEAAKNLDVMIQKQAKDQKTAVLVVSQAQASNQATEQRLLAENALLRAEINKVEAAEVRLLAELQHQQEELQALQQEVAMEVREVELRVGVAKERLKMLEAGLKGNSDSESEDLAQLKAAQEELHKLEEQWHTQESPIVIATLESQNAAMEAESKEGARLVAQATYEEAAAIANLEQANATIVAEREAAKIAANAIIVAQHEAEIQLQRSVNASHENMLKAAAKRRAADIAVQARCKSEWDAISSEIDDRMHQCRNWQERFDVLEAQRNVLRISVQGQVQAETLATTASEPM